MRITTGSGYLRIRKLQRGLLRNTLLQASYRLLTPIHIPQSRLLRDARGRIAFSVLIAFFAVINWHVRENKVNPSPV